jgi:hypothetical protein
MGQRKSRLARKVWPRKMKPEPIDSALEEFEGRIRQITREHTRTPFRTQRFDEGQTCILGVSSLPNRSPLVAVCTGENKDANAEFIVHACNAFDRMLGIIVDEVRTTMSKTEDRK